MPRVLEDRESHALVQHDDGEVELIPWSGLNRLVYKHNLEGVLKTGDEVLTIQNGDSPQVSIIADDDATEYDLVVGDDRIHLSSHQKGELVERLMDAYEADDGPSPQPFLKWAGELLDTKANQSYVDQFADLPVFAGRIEVRSDGWLINDHLLLTYDNEFYHPNIDSRSAGDATLKQDDSVAYDTRFRPGEEGQSEIGDFDRIGTADDQETFVAMALWAVKYAPEPEAVQQ